MANFVTFGGNQLRFENQPGHTYISLLGANGLSYRSSKLSHLTILDRAFPSTQSRISLLGANGLSFRSSKVSHLRVLSQPFPSSQTLISLLGVNGLSFRSSKVKHVRLYNPPIGGGKRETDGIAWPTGVQRFGND
ncbi:MAG: hypothetical protein CL959_01865 [Euryarchaeota archaeon]|nr:hypothetical protein [Euryarchaeota archaeon]|tara:strand:+ start:5840 stop:6244 length:405 start_codon:yes stop_codon:yes gene_type:complete